MDESPKLKVGMVNVRLGPQNSMSIRTRSSGVPVYVGCMWLTELCTIKISKSPKRSYKCLRRETASKVSYQARMKGKKLAACGVVARTQRQELIPVEMADGKS